MGQFLTAEEVGEIMGYSASHSYSIIRELNSELKAKGYITGVHRNILYFTEATCRKARLEAKAARFGLAFLPFPEDNTPLSNAI